MSRYNRLGKDGVSKVDTYDLGGEYGKVMSFYGSASNTVSRIIDRCDLILISQ